MNALILLSFLLAAASASWNESPKYSGPIHHPVIHKGVPVEPAAVQHARAAHLQALSAESDKHAHHPYHEDHQYSNEQHHEHHEKKYHGPLHYPVIKKGVPVEPVEVQHARKMHLQAFSLTANYGHHNHHNSHHEVPVIGHKGQPLDTVEVEEAKANHFAAYHKALSQASHHSHHHKKRSADSYVHFTSHVSHATPIYVDSHEDNYQYSGDDASYSHQDVETHLNEHGYSTHQEHPQVYGHHKEYHHYEQEPQFDHDGLPLDTPEVAHAKALHLEAHLQASYNHGYSSYGHNEPVTDTPEVQHARAVHLAAHAAAKTNNNYYHH